jgi:hypothetical protein
MSVVAQILRLQHPSAIKRMASLLPGYQLDTTYPKELEGGYHSFSDADDLRDFLRSSQLRYARSQGAQIIMLQMNGTSVWIKYPRGSAFYQRRVCEAIRMKNDRKRKKLFFSKLGKLLLDSLVIQKQNPA